MTGLDTATATVNGEALVLGDIRTLGDLLQHLRVVPARVVVELNGVIYRRGDGLDQEVRAGDVVEVVHFIGGG